MADFPKEVYSKLDGIESGKEIIESINTWKSGVNNEAKTMREQRNLILDALGVDHSKGVGMEDLSSVVTKLQEEKALSKREQENLLREKESKLNETQLLEKRLSEQAQQLESLTKMWETEKTQSKLAKKKDNIRKALSSKGVLSSYLDDLTEIINTKVIEKDNDFVVDNGGQILSIADGVSEYLKGKDSFIGHTQAPGSGGSSASPPKDKEPTNQERLERLRKQIKGSVF